MESFGLGDRWQLSPNRSHSPRATVSFKPAGSDAVMLIQILLSGLAIPTGLLGSAVQELKFNFVPISPPLLRLANHNPSSHQPT